MGSGIQGFAFAATGFLFSAQGAHAWYGPICYSDRTTQLVLTIPSISGETPGDLKVDFDDNDGKVKLGVVRASQAVKNAHEVVLMREPESLNGIFAVLVTSPRSTTGYKFELEFRKDASECNGAIIKATDRAGETLASAPVKPRPVRASRPKSVPVPALAAGYGATSFRVVNLDDSAKAQAVSASSSSGASEVELRPLPTPSAGSEVPAVNEPVQQQAGEAPKAEVSAETPAEAPTSDPAAQSSDAGNAAPMVSDTNASGN